ncbi:hypothetical protein OG937_38165 [Streptomyces sp. NBC_00510]
MAGNAALRAGAPGSRLLARHAGTRTSWTFRSGAAADTSLLPLPQVDYAVPVDARNAVGSQRTHDLGLNVRMQDGMATPRGVRLLVETSYDDGKTWPRHVRPPRAVASPPPCSGRPRCTATRM